ncbi:MAG: hypothetical protein ACREPW_06520 [Candidatus Binataceae bacterium]
MKPPEAALAPAPQSTSRPAAHIYVTDASLDTACFQKVGEVSYVEPFAAAATDPEHIGTADALRKAAVEKYPNQVDAIINVHANDHDVGSEVLVNGEAVQLEPPGRIGCKLPGAIAAALVSLAAGSKSNSAGREVSKGSVFDGLAGAANGAEETSGFRRALVATMPGQTGVNEQALAGQAKLQQAEIKNLRTELDQIISGRCEAADISIAQCASMRNSAELEQSDAVVAVTSKESGNSSPSIFEIQNLVQAQGELIAKLRRRIADMNHMPNAKAAAGTSN